MKHSVALKFLAMLLCALSVVSIAACGFGILFMENWNLYNMPLEDIRKDRLESMSNSIAWNHAQFHAAQSLSNCPREMLDDILLYSNYVPGNYAVEIFLDGETVYTMNDPGSLRTPYVSEHTVTPDYPIATYQYTQHEGYPTDDLPHVTEPLPTVETPAAPIEFDVRESGLLATHPPMDFTLTESTAAPTAPAIEFDIQENAPTLPSMEIQLPESTEPVVIPPQASAASTAAAPAAASAAGTEAALWASARDSALERVAGQEVLYSSEHSETHLTDRGESYEVIYQLDYYTGPTYLVRVYLEEQSVLGTEYALMSVLYPYRAKFIPLLLGSLLVFAVTLAYLLAAAGCAKNGEISPAGLNRLPLDIYALGSGFGTIGLIALLIVVVESFGGGYYGIWDNLPLCMLVIGTGTFCIALLILGFLVAFSAQSKLKGGYWWRHSVCGRGLQYLADFLRWVRRGLQYFYRGCRAVVRLLPLIWQWLLTAFVMVIVPFFALFLCSESHGFGEVFWLMVLCVSVVADIALVLYGAWCFGALLKAARHMARGNLDYQVDTRFLFGCFKDFAEHLNSLAVAARQAAEKQMKSERMKTELITNVSHDIKTPLTSIINYVDLMKMPHSEEDHATYLDVLDRQSQRLKKLIGDLMDMSKASSGNMTVELGQVDAEEAVNQALGEFADKLDHVGLIPVFRHPDHPVIMRADGRLFWRILSNLLSNAVKYAMPNTRLYVDLMVLQDKAVLAIKNISRDQLNVNAEELMERFVRGDTSRNTEGSGLGLNIAKSLAELQGGQLHLMVDGDLFKVTLVFPLV